MHISIKMHAIFLGLLITNIMNAAASSNDGVEYSICAREFAIHRNEECAAQQYTFYQPVIYGDTDDRRLARLLHDFAPKKLPNAAIAHRHIMSVQERYPEWRELFNNNIKHLQNPNMYEPLLYPSRMVFYGLFDYEKEITALALAKECNLVALCVNAEQMHRNGRGSAARFLDCLFDVLKDHPEQRFLVIIDKLKYIAQQEKYRENLDQEVAIYEFCHCLDSIEKLRHISVLGLDCEDPSTYDERVQIRVFNNIFKIEDADVSPIVESARSSLSIELNESSELDESKEPARSDFEKAPERKVLSEAVCTRTYTRGFSHEILTEYVRSVMPISQREIFILFDCAKSYATHEALGAQAVSATSLENIIVQERHLAKAFRPHRKSLIQAHPVAKEMLSVRTLAYGLTALCVGLVMYAEKQDKQHLCLRFLAQMLSSFNA